ncbi:hypothetical protein AXG93_3954s1060 [Marchantia polymorpha subsp. ruderalis]|uniref:Uncharacterized protein n=1 Tax=Marchantia polymorpha subsp. ruderalis TaxID=1480154 RepID=A0A176VNM8_MARPO|nr:hypothetical protein AXG93_3954s1060 [Marchantia polymorpha subsp. ruderalis]
MRMIPLWVPQIGLRAFKDELQAVKLNFLLWGWNWACGDSKSACARDVLAFGASAFGGVAFDAETLRKHPYARRQGGRRQECGDTCAFCGRSERVAFGGTRVTKYGDPRQGGSYVELVQNRTRIKVAANPALIAQDQKYQNLEERYNFLQYQWALTRKLQKAALKLQDEMVERARRELNELHAKVQTDLTDEWVQIRNLTEELVWKTRALEESEYTMRADEELLGRLQSQCKELRAQRAAVEVRLAEEKTTTGARQIARKKN